MSNKSKQHKGIPGWNEFVREYKDSALFWHKLWKDNGSPNSGVLFDLRRSTRYKYHHALKTIKRQKDSLRADNMAKNVNSTGKNRFWSELRNTLGCSNTVPCTVDGISGIDNIANLFSDKYSALYNSVSYDKHDMSKLVTEVDNLCTVDNTVHDIISVKEVMDAISAVKPNKADMMDIVVIQPII